jgi:glycosyltransferase involved in cell wall biosynthesis
MNKKIKVCFFGIYDPLYNRYKVITEGLKAKKMDFSECGVNKNYGSYLKNLLFVNLFLIKKFLNIKKDFTHMVVWGYRESVFPAYLLSKIYRKKLIFDPVTSVYSTIVEERKLIPKFSFKAKLLFIYEKLAYKLPDHLLATTEEFKQHFCNLFSIKPEKISVLPVGGIVEKLHFKSLKKKKKNFKILYWGGFHPQHGVEFIIRAAKLVEEYAKGISFMLIGKGHSWEESINLSKNLRVSNIIFTGYLSDEKLRGVIINSDLILGFFGSSQRAGRSIGNKVFEGLSYGKPVITEKSKAVRRFFTHKKELYLVKPNNEKEIAEGIINLHEDAKLREKIALCGYKRLKRDFSEGKIAEKMINLISVV